jgi:hypothetical protein
MTPLALQMLVRPGCLRTSYAVKGEAHQPDVLRRSGACQLCSSALLGEELCFRHTTILGSCRDLTALAAPLPRRPYSLCGLVDGCAALFGPFGCPRRSLGKRTHGQEGTWTVCAWPAVFLKYQKGLTAPGAANSCRLKATTV